MQNKQSLHYTLYQEGKIDKDTYKKICELLNNVEELKELKELFSKATPKELLDNSKDLFNAFLASKFADNLNIRLEMLGYQEAIQSFFQNISDNKTALNT